jgi:hypothetical protein
MLEVPISDIVKKMENVSFTRQYEALQVELTTQIVNLKAEIAHRLVRSYPTSIYQRQRVAVHMQQWHGYCHLDHYHQGRHH